LRLRRELTITATETCITPAMPCTRCVQKKQRWRHHPCVGKNWRSRGRDDAIR